MLSKSVNWAFKKKNPVNTQYFEKILFIMHFLKTPLFEEEKKNPISRSWIKLTLNDHEKKNVEQVKDFMWWGSTSTIVVYIEKKHVWAVCLYLL